MTHFEPAGQSPLHAGPLSLHSTGPPHVHLFAVRSCTHATPFGQRPLHAGALPSYTGVGVLQLQLPVAGSEMQVAGAGQVPLQAGALC